MLTTPSNALVPASNAEVYRASTDAAGLCREIVLKTAQAIQGRKYVKVEGWQAIAIAHGCAASADHVERVEDEGMSGFKATGIVRRMSDGAEIARAEGFLGDDEVMWSKRPVYARRAMVQTRAISRACRSAFAHVVVLIDAGLSTTPAEEVPFEGFDNEPRNITPSPEGPDFPGAEGSQGRSAYRAKKDGGSERFNAIKAEIETLNTMVEVGMFQRERTEEIKGFPESWRKLLREALDEQKHAIAQQSPQLDGERVDA